MRDYDYSHPRDVAPVATHTVNAHQVAIQLATYGDPTVLVVSPEVC